MVLYFLSELDIELTRAQLTTVSAEKGLLPYFELQSAIYELEEQGMVAAVPRPFGQAYRVTPKGEETLNMFGVQLPESLRAELSAYAESCREQLLRQTQYVVSSTKLPDSDAYSVTLKTLERDVELMSISLVLPDLKSANQACKAWPAAAGNIYKAVLENLLTDIQE